MNFFVDKVADFLFLFVNSPLDLLYYYYGDPNNSREWQNIKF